MFYSDIIKEGAKLFCLPYAEIVGPTRRWTVVRARNAISVALNNRGVSYSQIARLMGRDHSTIMHGCKKARLLMQHDDGYAIKIMHLVRLGRKEKFVRSPFFITDVLRYVSQTAGFSASEVLARPFLRDHHRVMAVACAVVHERGISYAGIAQVYRRDRQTIYRLAKAMKTRYADEPLAGYLLEMAKQEFFQ